MTAGVEILVGIDDTDSLESRGTGELAAELAAAIEEKGWGRSSFVSRHQLLIHPDVPYTSHNSAMCFPTLLIDGMLEKFIDFAGQYLERESAPGSDPGLCVAVRPLRAERLVSFGHAAKRELRTKEEAMTLARDLGVHLSEHGGSGQGIIGALAGVGLRLTGCDGRLRGQLQFDPDRELLSVAALCAHPYIDRVEGLNGQSVGPLDRVRLARKPKTVLKDGESVLLVTPLSDDCEGADWRTCDRRLLKGY